jgi:hypothetical protein
MRCKVGSRVIKWGIGSVERNEKVEQKQLTWFGYT